MGVAGDDPRHVGPVPEKVDEAAVVPHDLDLRLQPRAEVWMLVDPGVEDGDDDFLTCQDVILQNNVAADCHIIQVVVRTNGRIIGYTPHAAALQKLLESPGRNRGCKPVQVAIPAANGGAPA